MMKILHRIIVSLTVATTVLLLLSSSCSKKEVETYVSIGLSETDVQKNAGSVWVKVSSNTDWTLSLDFGEGQEAWAELSRAAGSGEENDVSLKFYENTGEFARSLTVKVVDKGRTESAEVKLVQKGSYFNTEVTSDPVCGWMELPAVKEEEGLYFFTHYHTIVNTTLRSWSYQWDTDALVAHWVAYPLNRWMIGSGGRTDDWGLDPKLPASMQPVLYKGFYGENRRYDRGHQLPSADRLHHDSNVQTFYGTNMTPQKGELNQNVWASLEGYVRDKAGALDTLYVVTGCTVEGSNEYAFDNNGKKVTVPTGYFKALLGYKKDMSVATATKGYIGIAFWFDHEAYDGSYMDKAMSIAELEDLLDMDFFVNLPSKIGNQAAIVEASTESWWWNK
ncbi:MAG: DNA/RNA non-specific endonuclease [Bacteroidales bacterium]|nr:DNA/RNA non-specific endonuclease [Bacteroidales bacterium]